MAEELELKAVVPDLDALRDRLREAGAVERFCGRMSDRRYDRGGELTARDEVLRVRSYRHPDGHAEWVLGWKGPARRSPEGYKQREEIELPMAESTSPDALLRALGYEVVHAIDRDVEVFALDGASLRLERYPRMDTLLEVEGDPAAIERAIAASGLPRADFTADSLAELVRRFEARSGTPAALSLL
jgi:adenylate cyclase class IV